MSNSLKQLTQLVTEFRDERDWKQFHTVKDMMLSLMLEAAELAEHSQWKNEEEFQDYLKGHRDEIGDELADVLYWVLLLAHDLEVDMCSAFTKKLDRNREKYPIALAKGKSQKYDSL